MEQSECPRCGVRLENGRCGGCGIAARPGGYVTLEVLSESGQARTYLAQGPTGEKVFLKELVFVLAPDASTLEAFAREAELLRQLRHPQIPRYLAHFSEGDGVQLRLYLAEEFVEGRSLAAELATHRYTEPEAKEVATQVLQVLEYLHSLSPPIVHRDLKPANVVRRADGTLCLVDFGSAHDAALRQRGGAVTQTGTLGYAAPEQVLGEATPASDLHALGATLLHLLSRRAPWEHLEGGLASAAAKLEVSSGFRTWLQKLLAPDPAVRFASATAARAAMHAPRRRRLPGGRVALAGVLVALAALSYPAYRGYRHLTRVRPVGVEEFCPEGTELAGEVKASRSQYCASSTSTGQVKEGVSVTYGESLRPREIAHYRQDVLHGRFRRMNGDKVESEGNYLDGEQDGEWTLEREKGRFVKGQRTGTWTRFQRDGHVERVAEYLDGKEHGVVVEFDSNSAKRQEKTYSHGLEDGVTTRYHANGQVSTKTNFVRGVKEGLEEEFAADGKKRVERSFSNGEEHGTTRYFDPDGKLRKEQQMEFGRPRTVRCYDPSERLRFEYAYGAQGLSSFREFGEDGAKVAEMTPCEDFLRNTCLTEYYPGGERRRLRIVELRLDGLEPQVVPSRDPSTYTEWHPDGKLRTTGTLGFGGQIGRWVDYWPNGKPQRVREYRGGRFVGEYREYHENGKVRLSGSYDERGVKTGLWQELGPRGEVVWKKEEGKARP